MKYHEIDFCFKGERNYVHGTDIYNKLNEFISNKMNLRNIAGLDMTLHKIIRNNLTLEIYKNEAVDRKENTTAIFSFNSGSDRYVLLMLESDKKIECRYDYPEEEIVQRCNISVEEERISLDSDTAYTDIEVFTAMNKALLQAVYPDAEGKWFLARFQAGRYEKKSSYDSLSVELKHNFNFKLTKSSIRMDNKEKGFIYFTLIR